MFRQFFISSDSSYLGRVPKEVEAFHVAADLSKILEKAGEMNRGILHDNLVLLFDLSGYYDVAEPNESIGDAVVSNTFPNITWVSLKCRRMGLRPGQPLDF